MTLQDPQLVRKQADYVLTREAVSKSVCSWWSFITNKHPSETFYAFIFGFHDDFAGAVGAANSNENLARELGKTPTRYKYDEYKHTYEDECVWNPAYWYMGGDREAGGNFDAAWQYMKENEEQGVEESERIYDYRARLLGATIDALTELRNGGLWAPTDMGIIVYCEMWDAFEAKWLRNESARRINPPGILESHPLNWSAVLNNTLRDYADVPKLELARAFHDIFDYW